MQTDALIAFETYNQWTITSLGNLKDKYNNYALAIWNTFDSYMVKAQKTLHTIMNW